MIFTSEDLGKAEKRFRGWLTACRTKHYHVAIEENAERALLRIMAQLVNRMSRIRHRGEVVTLGPEHCNRARNILDSWMGECAQNNCKVNISLKAEVDLLVVLATLVACASPATVFDFCVDIESAFTH